MRKLNLLNHRFDLLTVIKELPKVTGRTKWICLCDCGKTTIVATFNLRSGHIRSCGCLKKFNNFKHGHTDSKGNRTTEYITWGNIRKRCHTKSHKDYHLYGGRGIKVCECWYNSFPIFFADVGKRPSFEYSLGRINNNGHYSCGKCKECLANSWPLNVRWETKIEQANNKRNNRYFTIGDEHLTMAQIARRYNIPYQTFVFRLRKWSLMKAINTPVKRRS